jgi:hypothetical protein
MQPNMERTADLSRNGPVETLMVNEMLTRSRLVTSSPFNPAAKREVAMRKTTLMLAALLGSTAAPACATITFGNQTLGQGEVVLLGNGTSGTTVQGTTNQTHTLVNFISGPTSTCPGCVTQTLSEPSTGQARVEVLGADTVLQSLTIQLADLSNPLAGIGYIEFNLDETASLGNAINVVINAVDQNGNPFTTSAAVGNGSNWFSALASDGEVIRSISFDAAGTTGFTDIRQVRLGPALGLAPSAVPEPATWAMMIIGLGAMGFASRRKRHTLALNSPT